MQEYILKDGPCGVEFGFKIIGARWKSKILEICYLQNGASFQTLRELIPDCSKAVLSKQLSGMINDGLLDYSENEVYILTTKARDVLPILSMMQQLTYFCNFPESGYDSAIEYAKRLIGEKWKSRIIWVIHHYTTIRFNDLQKSIDGISHKILNQQLEDMRDNNLIEKTEYSGPQRRTEYSLTDTGKLAFDIIQTFAEWAMKYGLIRTRTIIFND